MSDNTSTQDTPSLSAQGTDGLFTLPSSHILSYRVYGPPTGHPLFFFHGTPGSRYDAGYFAPHLDKLNVRMIALDRPGYGLSTPNPTRTIPDYPKDVLALADHLEVPQFSVAGISGGGPYALACALSLPRERLRTTSVIAGVGQTYLTGTRGMGFSYWNAMVILLWAYSPSWIGRSLAWILFSRIPSTDREKLQGLMSKAVTKVKNPRDKLPYDDPHVLDVILDSWTEALRPGMGGYYTDCDLMTGDWGFTMDDIRNRPDGPGRIVLSYGSRDDTTTPIQARHLLKGLGGSEVQGPYGDGETKSDGVQLRVYDDESHGTLFTLNGEDILKEIVGVK